MAEQDRRRAVPGDTPTNAAPKVEPSFFAELKQRHVVRAAIVYAAAVWALAQGISQLSPVFGLSERVTLWFVIACVIGFPFWLAFAWYFRFTAHGIERESEAVEDNAEIQRKGRKLDYWIIGIMAVAIVLLLTNQLVLQRGKTIHEFAASAAPAAAFNPPADTLVVLPFANLSGDKSQQYFSDGITEELTNALGQNTALRVIAWDTASHYRDTTQPATAIGKALDVANVLTGKILRQGNAVRVIVELVDTRTGYQLWADHYDASLANVFQVQDHITTSIAQALKVKFASLGPARTVSPRAHDLVLQARALMEKSRSAAPFEQARKLFEQAIALDPAYAEAHAGLAHAWFDLTEVSTLSLKETLPKVRAEANKALALDPRNARALVALADADLAGGKHAEAKAYYERALALDPSNAVAHLDFGNLLPLKQKLAQTLEAVQLDPDSAGAQNSLAGAELDSGEYTQALIPAQALMRLDPTSADSAMGLALVYSLLHSDAEAVKAFDLAQPDTELAKALVAAGRLTYQSLIDPELHAKALAAVDALRKRSDLDPDSMGNVMELELALGENTTALEQLPKLCASLWFACNDLSVFPLWIPLRGDPRFEALVKQYDTVSKPAPAATAAPASASSAGTARP